MKLTTTFVGKKKSSAARKEKEERTHSLSRSQTPTTALSSSEETARTSTSPRASGSSVSLPSTPQLARETITSGPERFTLPPPTSPHRRTGSCSLSSSREPAAPGASKTSRGADAPQTPRTARALDKAASPAERALLGGDSPPIRQTGAGALVGFQVHASAELGQWESKVVQLALEWINQGRTLEAMRLLLAVAAAVDGGPLRRRLLRHIKNCEPLLIDLCRQCLQDERVEDAVLLLDTALSAADNHHFPLNLLRALAPELIPLAHQAPALMESQGIGRAIRLLSKRGWWHPQQPCCLEPAVRTALLALSDWASVAVALDQEVSERLGQPVQASGPDGVEPLLDALETLFHGADEHQDKPLMQRLLGWTQYLASHGASALASQAELLTRHECLNQRCVDALRHWGRAIRTDQPPPQEKRPALAHWQPSAVSARGPRDEPSSPVRLSGGGLRGSDPSSEKRPPGAADGIETVREQPIDRASALRLCIEHAMRTKTLEALLDHLRRWQDGPPTKQSLASLLDIAGQAPYGDAPRAALIERLIAWLPAGDPVDAALHTACVTAILGLPAGEARERCVQRYLAAFATGAEKEMAQLFALSSDARDIAALVLGLLKLGTQ